MAFGLGDERADDGGDDAADQVKNALDTTESESGSDRGLAWCSEQRVQHTIPRSSMRLRAVLERVTIQLAGLGAREGTYRYRPADPGELIEHRSLLNKSGMTLEL